MRSISRWLWIMIVAAWACATPLRAADKLESIMKKDQLTSEDKARVDQEIQERAARLLAVADRPVDEREEARQRIIETAEIRGATDVALTYYAERCGHHLTLLVVGAARPAADDAALVLRALKRPETADALITGLRSPHESVQYQCAVGVKELHDKIGNDRALATDALEALGEAGAGTSNAVLLRAVYEAINFAGSDSNFRGADLQAQALSKVFAARLKRLKIGSRDEYKDALGYQAARDAAGAGIAAKRELLGHLVAFYRIHAERFADRGTNKGYIATLRTLVEQLERAIEAIMRSENTTPPGRSLSSVVGNAPSSATARRALEAAQDLQDALKGDPWKLP